METGVQRKVWQHLGVSFAAWSVVAIVAYARVPLQALAFSRALPPLIESLNALVGCWIWVPLTPPILWLAERYPLDARMHPHFLFNALNTISSLVRTGDSKAAVRAVARLGDLLRSLLLDDGQEIPLAQELDFVGRYLELERARFGDRLSARIDADPAVMDALVPRLVLQPLVENALRHR